MYQKINFDEYGSYVLSGWVKLETATNLLVVVNNTYSASAIFGKRVITGSGWQKFVIPLNVTGNLQAHVHLGGYATLPTGEVQSNGDVLLWNFKLEKGNVVTDWSPAPEDCPNYITAGGRNLVLNSKVNVTNREYGILSFLLSEEPKVGEQLTITLKGVLGAGKSSFRLYNKGGYQELCILRNKGNGIYQSTFNWASYPTNPKLLVIYVFDSSVIVNSTVEWIKLERGNTPTDWTPAPEDIISVTRAGASISSNWVATQGWQNRVIFVESSLNIELNNLEEFSSISFIKIFNGGNITFSCGSKNIVLTGDQQFNGKDGSTAKASIAGHKCYIQISNVN